MRTRQYFANGALQTEYYLDVPLDYRRADGPQITLFAREYERLEACPAHLAGQRQRGAQGAGQGQPGLAAGGEEESRRPYLLFLQGGPGYPGNRAADPSGWMDAALDDYRILMLDQRGTGLSTPVHSDLVKELGAEGAAEYLTHFRADAIVEDCEALRRALGVEQWSTLGQSYGGFITLCYLSRAPQSLRECFVTGGLAALDTPLEELYRETFAQTALANQRYFAHYPEDEQTLREVCAYLDGGCEGGEAELLPSGEQLTSLRLRQLGLSLGGQIRFHELHYLLEAPFVQVGGRRRLSERFKALVFEQISFAAAPFYALLHELIYAGATPAIAGLDQAWTAARLREEIPGFSAAADPLDTSQPYYLSGEHIYPEFFAADPALQPWAQVADILARKRDWPALYDPQVLAANRVPVTAAVYLDDIFVPYRFSAQTARAVGNLRSWQTNQYAHDGLRASGKDVWVRLLQMRRGLAPTH